MEEVLQTRKFLLLFLIIIPLIIISTFRDGLGTDYYSYVFAYINPEVWNQESLFKLLFITLPRFISQNEILFFFLTSLVVCYYFLKRIYISSLYVSISIIIFITQIYFSSFNVVRQFVALAIFSYYGFKFFKNNQVLKYLILIIMLAQIHYSMYLLLLFPLFWNSNKSLKNYWIIWLCSLLFFVFVSLSLFNLADIFKLISYLPFTSQKFELLQASSDFFLSMYKSDNQLIVKNLICLIFLLRLKYIVGTLNMFWLNLYLFGIFLQNFLVQFSLLAVRIGYFGDVALLMLVPVFIKTFTSKPKRVVLMVLFIIYFLSIFYLRFILNGESEVFKKTL